MAYRDYSTAPIESYGKPDWGWQTPRLTRANDNPLTPHDGVFVSWNGLSCPGSRNLAQV